MSKVLNSKTLTILYKWALPIPFIYYVAERLITYEGFSIDRDWFFMLFSAGAILIFKFKIFTLLDEVVDNGESIYVRRGNWQFSIPFDRIIEFETDGLNVIIHPKGTGELPNELHFIRSLKQPAFGTLDLVTILNRKIK